MASCFALFPSIERQPIRIGILCVCLEGVISGKASGWFTVCVNLQPTVQKGFHLLLVVACLQGLFSTLLELIAKSFIFHYMIGASVSRRS